MDDALVDGALYALDMLRIDVGWNINGDAEVIEARRILALAGGNTDLCSFFGEFVFAQISGGVEGGAGT